MKSSKKCIAPDKNHCRNQKEVVCKGLYLGSPLKEEGNRRIRKTEFKTSKVVIDDLCDEDKSKVARLVEKVMTLTHDNEELTKKLSTQKEHHNIELAEIDSENKRRDDYYNRNLQTMHQSKQNIETKFRNALLLLEKYQLKIEELINDRDIQSQDMAKHFEEKQDILSKVSLLGSTCREYEEKIHKLKGKLYQLEVYELHCNSLEDEKRKLIEEVCSLKQRIEVCEETSCSLRKQLDYMQHQVEEKTKACEQYKSLLKKQRFQYQILEQRGSVSERDVYDSDAEILDDEGDECILSPDSEKTTTLQQPTSTNEIHAAPRSDIKRMEAGYSLVCDEDKRQRPIEEPFDGETPPLQSQPQKPGLEPRTPAPNPATAKKREKAIISTDRSFAVKGKSPYRYPVVSDGEEDNDREMATPVHQTYRPPSGNSTATHPGSCDTVPWDVSEEDSDMGSDGGGDGTGGSDREEALVTLRRPRVTFAKTVLHSPSPSHSHKRISNTTPATTAEPAARSSRASKSSRSQRGTDEEVIARSSVSSVSTRGTRDKVAGQSGNISGKKLSSIESRSKSRPSVTSSNGKFVSFDIQHRSLKIEDLCSSDFKHNKNQHSPHQAKHPHYEPSLFDLVHDIEMEAGE